jgi:hypothetical protein
MPGFNTHSDNASNSTTEQDTDCLKAQRDADLFLFAMIGMVVTWFAGLIISVIELGV